jgi:membrane-bound serine protease (ClpP class)
MIDRGLLPLVTRAIEEAEKEKSQGIIFEINTFGGRIDAAVEIRDAIIKTKLMTIAFINRRAISAGALISIACDKIIMADGGTIGAATPVQMGPSQEMKPVEEKVVSYFRSEMRATAEHSGRNPQIAEAMVDPDVEIKNVSPKGKLLTLTTSDAMKLKFIDGLGGTIEDALLTLGFPQNQVREVRINWAEQFIRFITHPMVSSLLMAMGFLGLFMAFKTGSWGVMGSLAILALVFFFFGHYTVKLVGWEEIILFFLGMSLLMAEIFIIPGFGVVGIAGILAILTSLFLSLIDLKIPLNPPDFSRAFLQIGASFILTFIGIIAAIKFLPKSPWGQSLILKTEILGKNMSETLPQENFRALIGQTGVVYTYLRPVGTAAIRGRHYNVVSDGEYIAKNEPIRVIAVEGNRITVEKLG